MSDWFDDKVIVEVNGKPYKKTKEAIKKKIAEPSKQDVTINHKYIKLAKKFNEFNLQPYKLREVVFEMCDFFDEWTEEDLIRGTVLPKTIKFMREWKEVFKPL